MGLIHDEQVSFPDSEAKRVAGEFGNAFASGKVWSWLGGRVYTSGFDVPRIKDRFRWSLGPMPIGPIGEERHSWNDQPNLITNGAERLGISGVPDSGRPGRTQVPDRRPGSIGGWWPPIAGRPRFFVDQSPQCAYDELLPRDANRERPTVPGSSARGCEP